MSFPAALAILVDPRSDTALKGPEFVAKLAAAVAATPEAQQHGLDARALQDVIEALFVRRQVPSSTGRSDQLLELVLRKALEHQGFTVSAKEAREIRELLETGQFYHDLVGTAGAVFSTIPALMADLPGDVGSLPGFPGTGLTGLVGDFFDLLTSLAQVAIDLRDGKIDQPPPVMPRLLALLYGFGSIARIRDLLDRMLAPENRSVRLALILFARSNGFFIEDRQIDLLRTHLLATDKPDLGPVLAEALDVMKKRYAPSELEQLIGALGRG